MFSVVRRRSVKLHQWTNTQRRWWIADINVLDWPTHRYTRECQNWLSKIDYDGLKICMACYFHQKNCRGRIKKKLQYISSLLIKLQRFAFYMSTTCIKQTARINAWLLFRKIIRYSLYTCLTWVKATCFFLLSCPVTD